MRAVGACAHTSSDVEAALDARTPAAEPRVSVGPIGSSTCPIHRYGDTIPTSLGMAPPDRTLCSAVTRRAPNGGDAHMTALDRFAP